MEAVCISDKNLFSCTFLPDEPHNACILQLGAKGDVEIRRYHDGTLVVPKKFRVGTQSIEDLIISTILSSKSVANAVVQAVRSSKQTIDFDFSVTHTMLFC